MLDSKPIVMFHVENSYESRFEKLIKESKKFIYENQDLEIVFKTTDYERQFLEKYGSEYFKVKGNKENAKKIFQTIYTIINNEEGLDFGFVENFMRGVFFHGPKIKAIWISKGLPLLEFAIVLLHEYIHYYFHIKGIKFRDDYRGIIEEMIIQCITYLIGLDWDIDTLNFSVLGLAIVSAGNVDRINELSKYEEIIYELTEEIKQVCNL